MSNPATQFQPGDPRINRNGAPKKEWTWAGLIREKMEEKLVGDDNKQVKDAVTNVLLAKALEGDLVAIKEVGNRLDGMPKQGVELSGDEDNPVRFDISVMLEKVYGSDKPDST